MTDLFATKFLRTFYHFFQIYAPLNFFSENQKVENQKVEHSAFSEWYCCQSSHSFVEAQFFGMVSPALFIFSLNDD